MHQKEGLLSGGGVPLEGSLQRVLPGTFRRHMKIDFGILFCFWLV